MSQISWNLAKNVPLFLHLLVHLARRVDLYSSIQTQGNSGALQWHENDVKRNKKKLVTSRKKEIPLRNKTLKQVKKCKQVK